MKQLTLNNESYKIIHSLFKYVLTMGTSQRDSKRRLSKY